MTEDDTFNALKKSTWIDANAALNEAWANRTNPSSDAFDWFSLCDEVLKKHGWTRGNYLDEMAGRARIPISMN